MQEWDRSHYMENLSGFETVCSMIGTVQWDFPYTTALNQQLGSHVQGQYGYVRNLGSTPDALDTILRKFNQVWRQHCINSRFRDKNSIEISCIQYVNKMELC